MKLYNVEEEKKEADAKNGFGLRVVSCGDYRSISDGAVVMKLDSPFLAVFSCCCPLRIRSAGLDWYPSGIGDDQAALEFDK